MMTATSFVADQSQVTDGVLFHTQVTGTVCFNHQSTYDRRFVLFPRLGMLNPLTPPVAIWVQL